MINTTGNVIALVSILSGIHARFANHPDEANVVLTYGDHQLGEQFVATSDKMVGEVRVYIENDSIHITYSHEGVTYTNEVFREFGPEYRCQMRDYAIDLLNGTVVIETI